MGFLLLKEGGLARSAVVGLFPQALLGVSKKKPAEGRWKPGDQKRNHLPQPFVLECELGHQRETKAPREQGFYFICISQDPYQKTRLVGWGQK